MVLIINLENKSSAVLSIFTSHESLLIGTNLCMYMQKFLLTVLLDYCNLHNQNCAQLKMNLSIIIINSNKYSYDTWKGFGDPACKCD